MNLDTIAQLTITAFHEDESMFHLVADALRDIGDEVNAQRFHNGNWTEADRIEAISYVHRDLIEKLTNYTGVEWYKALIEARKYPYLMEYLEQLNKIKYWVSFSNMKTEIDECRYLGKAARAMYVLWGHEFHDKLYKQSLAISRYRLCLTFGLWKDAAKWRKLGKGHWQWQLKAA